MGTYVKLHLANNLEALDLLAKKDCDVRKFKFQQICNALNKLFRESQLNILDQEKTYILLARYIAVYNHLKNTQSDKKFVELRFGSEYEKVLTLFEGTKKSLEKRFKEKTISVPVKPIIEEKEVINEDKPRRIFIEEFITCQQIYSALKVNHNILLLDARPENDYSESRIDNSNCINIPDHCITPGLSANTLGKKLPSETQLVWDKRDSFDVIVLFDWNTSLDNIATTKLNQLRSALVDWDLNRNYREQPVILNGGYLELLQTYPTICTNPHVYLYRKDNELDDLLELDNIKYPTETDNKTLVMGTPDENSIVEEPEIFNENTEDNDEVVRNRENNVKLLHFMRGELETTRNLLRQDPTNAFLKKNEEEFVDEITRLETLLEEVDTKEVDDKTNIQGDISSGLEGEIKPTYDESGDDPEIRKLADSINQKLSQELAAKARALKPKNMQNVPQNNLPVPEINRASKPTTIPVRRPVGRVITHDGLVGLHNIRNTCYMNTLIQCLRNLPAIKSLFCDGLYSRRQIREPSALIHETAQITRDMWTTRTSYLTPIEFYEKVCQLEPSYLKGRHEDCMEFFLFLLNHLCEDCTYTIQVPEVLTPKQKAWFNQFEGKNSIFINLFYHQIRIIQNCKVCVQKTVKFEIESTFMLHVPSEDFHLDDLMAEYMADFIIPDYRCAKCKKPVTNQKEVCYEPEIIVIVLKRYNQSIVNGNVNLRKIESKANFRHRDMRFGDARYELNAIVLHSGDLNFGHYTAAALTPNGWYEFNDENVRRINIDDDAVKIKACAFFYSLSDDKKKKQQKHVIPR